MPDRFRFALLVPLLATVSIAHAATWNVRLDGTGDFTAIQPALAVAAPGDTILVADGTYTGAANRNLNFGGKDLVLLAENDDPAGCIIDCQAGPGNEQRGFVFAGQESGATVVRGFTVRGGWVSGRGGGIFCYSASMDSLPAPRIENCVLTGNRAASGGGFAAVGYTVPRLEDCVVTGNTGGGAVWTGLDAFSRAGGSLVENCDLSGNTGPGLQIGGDGFYPYGSSLRLRDCTVADNTGTGLAIQNLSGFVRAETCTLSANGGWGVTYPSQAAPNGPASGTLRTDHPNLSDCLVIGNDDGGILGESDLESFLRCTVSGNGGPGIYDVTGQVTEIVDCVIEDNGEFGVFVTGYGTQFHGNTVRGNGDYGVWIDWNDGAIEIHDNVITDNEGIGLRFFAADSASEVELRDNVIAGNLGDGLSIEGAAIALPFVLLDNTIVANTGNGVACLTAVGLEISATVIADNDQASLAGAASTVLACTNLYGNALGDYVGDLAAQLGVDGNINADPMFCDPANGVFTLHALSPNLAGNHPEGDPCGDIGALGMGCPPPHSGGDWNVSMGGDDFFGSGDSGSPFATIQQAIDLAAAGDTIVVGAGTYTGEGNRDLDLGGKDLVIRSDGDDPAACIIDCEGAPGDEHRGFVFAGEETRATLISGFTIRGGWTAGDGGGVLLQWSGVDSLPAPRLERCVVTANTADRGAGLAIVGPAAPLVSDCAVTGNTGDGVGFAGADLAAGPLLIDSVVAGNSQHGVAVDVSAPTTWLALAGLTVADNGGHGVTCEQPAGLAIAGSIVAFNGQRALEGHDSIVDLACSDLFGNGGGDFVDDLAVWEGVQGNFGADPWFLDRPGGDFRLIDVSPCAPGQHPGDEDCGTIGALAVGALAAPAITEVSDVDNDQGRQVRLSWDASGFDRPGSALPITGYGVYRQQDDAAVVTVPDRRDLALPIPGWDFLETVPARGDSAYQYVAATLCDSTAAGICWSTFLVSAMTDDPYTYFDADPAQGYSVDNILPPAPALFTVEYRPDTQLSWQAADAPDLAWYNVYRGEAADFEPGEENLVAQVVGTSWSDDGAGWDFHYRVAAVDDAGNESERVAPNQEVAVRAEIPVATALVGNAPNPFNPATTIAFTLAGELPVTLRVFDLSGRLVRTLVAGELLPAGRHEATWRGRDDRGRAVASGMYLCRLEAGDVVATRRMALVK